MINKYGLFRYLVAKHFLSKSLEEIEEMQKLKTFDMELMTYQLLFKKTLNELFPSNYLNINMGSKFSKKVPYIFKNTYNQDKDHDLCEYKSILDNNYERMQCNQSYLEDLNLLF